MSGQYAFTFTKYLLLVFGSFSVCQSVATEPEPTPTCRPCQLGCHVEVLVSSTTVKGYYTDSEAHVENGPGQTVEQSADCTSSWSGRIKYTLTGSVAASWFGLSGSWETEKTSGTECTYTAKVTQPCTCAQGVCQTVKDLKTIVTSICATHTFNILPLWEVTCDCNVYATHSGTLKTITGKRCMSIKGHVVKGCGA